jgi:hypothetical protein
MDPLVHSHVFKTMGNIMFIQGVSPHPSSQATIDKEALIQLSNL